ncbi:restriction endonuclease subunit S [Bradyrhizobium diazoefficiens]|nr:restriction endonuclease subunit S [Bradyrhizobium diazoefficiens]
MGDLIELQSGGTPSKQQPKFWNGGVPWVSPKDVKVNRLFETQDTVTVDAIGNGTRAVEAGTLLMVVRSMILAREVPLTVSQRRMCFNQDIKAITPKDGVRNDYLIAWFFAHRSAILGIVDEAGHGTKRIQTDRLLALPVRLPPEAEQKRIASIFGAYDDLIAVNRRRIAALEEIARRLFEEWFVRFRFPAHQGHAMVDMPDGPIPDGWRISSIGTLATYLSRGIAPTYDANGPSLVINQKCIRDQRLSLTEARAQRREVPPEKLIQMGDVLINSTGVGTLGRVAQVEEVAPGTTVDSHVTIVRPGSQSDSDFFGLALLRMEATFERLGAGATGQTELNRGRIADQVLIEPPLKLQLEFGKHVRPIRSLAFKLALQNGVLAQARDLLLPRLISGDLSKSGAAREFEAVA